MESVHSVLVGEVNIALVTAPPQDAQITAVPFAPVRSTLYFQRTTPLLTKNTWFSRIWPRMKWILFPKRFDPIVFETIMDAAQRGSIAPRHAHDVIAPQQAVDLVSEHIGVAILTNLRHQAFILTEWS